MFHEAHQLCQHRHISFMSELFQNAEMKSPNKKSEFEHLDQNYEITDKNLSDKHVEQFVDQLLLES